MYTRGASSAGEHTIHDLYILTFTDGSLADIHEVAIDTDLSPVENTNNKYSIINWTILDGDHKMVFIANTAALNAPKGVQVGDIIWATTNTTEPGIFADTPYRYDAINYFRTWNQLTGGISGETAPGYCPDGWRLPTQPECATLVNASTYAWTSYADPANGLSVLGGELTIKTTGEKLFFSASGGTSDGVSYVYQGQYGFYWSSTQNGNNYGYNLRVGTGVDSAHSNGSYKDNLDSFRCVRDASSTRAGVGDIAVGQTYEQVKAALVGELGNQMYGDGGAIPMWGESGVITAGENNNINIDLYRSVVKIDVEVETGVPFEMTNVIVARPNNKYSLIADAAKLDANGKPVAPSVPAGTAMFTLEESEELFTYTGSVMQNAIYVPEAELADEFESRMALVIGGKYKGLDPNNETVTWYRVDFLHEGNLVDVVRNHRYAFSITSVGGPGSPDLATAYALQASNLTFTTVGWNVEEMPTELGR